MVVEKQKLKKHSYRIKKKAHFISIFLFIYIKKFTFFGPIFGWSKNPHYEDNTPLTSPQACTRDQKKHKKKSVVRSPSQQQLI